MQHRLEDHVGGANVTFTEQKIREAFERTGGRCECNLGVCGHPRKCGAQLEWEARGVQWDVEVLDAEGEDDSLSLVVLCADCLKTWRPGQ
jgi:hypothetical protein